MLTKVSPIWPVTFAWVRSAKMQPAFSEIKSLALHLAIFTMTSVVFSQSARLSSDSVVCIGSLCFSSDREPAQARLTSASVSFQFFLLFTVRLKCVVLLLRPKTIIVRTVRVLRLETSEAQWLVGSSEGLDFTIFYQCRAQTCVTHSQFYNRNALGDCLTSGRSTYGRSCRF